LAAAQEENPHVLPPLTGHKKMPRTLPDYYTPGEKTEAVSYVSDNLSAWRSSPGSLKWLASKTA